MTMNLYSLRKKVTQSKNLFQEKVKREAAQMQYPQSRSLNIKPSEELEEYIKTSDFFISSSNNYDQIEREKRELIDYINNKVRPLCEEIYGKTKPIKIESATVIFSMDKLNKRYLNSYFQIPYEDNPWHVSGKLLLGKQLSNQIRDVKKLCIGKALLNNYLSKIGILFMAYIISSIAETNESLLSFSGDINIILPLSGTNQNNDAFCQVYNTKWTDCKVLQTTEKFISCSCKSLGYFYAGISNRTADLMTSETNSQSNLIDKQKTTLKPRSSRKDVSSNATPTFKNEVETSTNTPHFVQDVENKNSENLTTNVSKVRHSESNDDYKALSFVVILGSVVGIAGLIYFLRRINKEDEESENEDERNITHYAQLYNVETLEDNHI